MTRGRRSKLAEPVTIAHDGATKPNRLAWLLDLVKENPTLSHLTEDSMPLDEQDRELGRRPLRLREHAKIVQANTPEHLRGPDQVEVAVAVAEDARRRRAADASERLWDKIESNEALGLHRAAPATEEDRVMDSSTPAPAPQTEGGTSSPPVASVAPEAGVTASDDAAAIDAAKQAGFGQVNRIAETLERRVLQRMPTLRGRSLRSLEEAADVLIAELDLGDQDAIRQVMAEHGLANWVVVLGAVKRMADLQELNAGEFTDAWLNRQSGHTPATAQVELCQMCGGALPPDPVRRGRTACCNRHGSGQVEHTEGCSLAHLKLVRGAWVEVVAKA